MDWSKDRDQGTRTPPDQEVLNLAVPAMQLHLEGRSADLDLGLPTPAEQETPGKQAAAMTLGELIAGRRTDGNPKTGPAIPGRESDTANPTWSQDFNLPR